MRSVFQATDELLGQEVMPMGRREANICGHNNIACMPGATSQVALDYIYSFVCRWLRERGHNG